MDNILVVDDDKEIVKSIEIFFRGENVKVFKAYDGEEALDAISKHDIHLIIMDVMMPKLNGIDATVKIRENKNIPIIILSAKGEDMDKVLGLTVGADDYITKPFNPIELIARSKAALRRYKSLGIYEKNIDKSILYASDMELNLEEKNLKVRGEEVLITALEFKILNLLMKNTGKVFSSEEIYEKVWNEPCYNIDTVMVHIRRIRKKIEENSREPKILKVVWGIGYKIDK